MKFRNLLNIISVFIIAVCAFQLIQAQTPRWINSKGHAIMVHATTKEDPPSITLNWPLMTDPSIFEVSRKLKSDLSWTKLAELDSASTSFTDNSVKVGIAYEYQIRSISEIYVKIDNTNKPFVQADKDGNGWMPYVSAGYVYSGINVPPPTTGKVLLLIEEDLSTKLDAKIAQLETDIIAEGWTVVKRLAKKTENFNGEAVKEVKNIIKEEYNKDPNNLTTVLLLGRIAVPYSGNFSAATEYPPDGHVPDHNGAWPADVYYGILNDNLWTDATVNNTTGITREANKNIPGDGKFDPSTYLYDNVSLQIGRVDLYNMPAFYDTTTKKGTELDLIANYLDKNHNYRTGKVEYINKGIISDGFSSMMEGFASSGWRNFASFFSADSVVTGNWVREPDSTKTYLWAYGCAGGNYRGYGSGSTADFAAKNNYTIFTMLFGSYFGDWDIDNAFLRAPLASKHSALTCGWSGRPHWFMHHMGLGENIGSSFLISANNMNTYVPNQYFYFNYQQWYTYISSRKTIHIALMGDPTLRMNYKIVQPPKDLTLKQIEDRKLELSWKGSNDKEAKYFIYRAMDGAGASNVMSKFTLLNSVPLEGTNFVDSTIVNGNLHYKVVAAVKVNTIGSGSYYTQSAYITDNTTITNVDEIPEIDFSLKASPNPADNYSEISYSLNKSGFVDLSVYDLSGNTVKTFYRNFVSAGTQNINWDLTDEFGNKVSSGVYFIKISADGVSKIEKVIVR